ncbi:hypothetical protein K2X30_07400 [bacterium]|nr:hypothetical protein [bacterium]
MTHYLGLGKTLFNSSACLVKPGSNGARPEVELVLSERITRKKASGIWPEQALRLLQKDFSSSLRIAENRDVLKPSLKEDALNRAMPFYDYLQREGLERFSQKFNSELEYVTHHRAHAYAALMMSPFRKSIILVMDGAGSNSADFSPEGEEIQKFSPASLKSDLAAFEEYSVFLQDEGSLQCVEKGWQSFTKSSRVSGQEFSSGLGMLYEKSAEYIFNSKRAAGKVMGLAAFGKPTRIEDREVFLNQLNWELSFQGDSKKSWESSGYFSVYSDVAASVQQNFEETYLSLAQRLRVKFPKYENLIVTGGCALNCVTNMKLVRAGIFSEIYSPPFPGDECIGLGSASYLYFEKDRNPFQPLEQEQQGGYFGPRSSIPEDQAVENLFREFEIVKPGSIAQYTARVLADGHVVGWFQGRSESGPRALGNRSILARPDRPGLKNYLNQHIKFREGFRPYGCSALHEKAAEYFDVPVGFNNPYMSFSPKTRPEYLAQLAEVTHVDGTSRMQTVRKGQNPLFHSLIDEFGKQTGLFCLLNTSLNVMGEPIAESISDVKRLLEETPIYGIAVGNYFIRRTVSNG